MEVVPLAGAVGGIIVTAEDGQLFQLPCSHTANVRHQIVGDAVGIVAQQAGLMGTDGIKVAQQDGAEVRVCSAVVSQNPLDHHLGPAVRRRRLNGRHLLLVGMGIVGTVNGSRGREHQLLTARLFHDLQKCQSAVQIVSVILQRLPDTLAHCLKACKVDHGINFVVLEYLQQFLLVRTVDLIKSRNSTSNLTDPVADIPAGVAEIIHNDRMVACVHQFHYGMAADIACATSHQNIHIFIPPDSHNG